MNPRSDEQGPFEIPGELGGRVWIQNVRPAVDNGRHPIKRTVGEEVAVSADIFADSHDRIAAALRYRPRSSAAWLETPMKPVGDDVWNAAFAIRSLEPYLYTILAWVDHFQSWRDEVRKKFNAGQDIASELLEGAHLIEAAAERADDVDATFLRRRAEELTRPDLSAESRMNAALAEDLSAVMARHPDLGMASEYQPALLVDVDRELARFGAWYEMFPRSAAPEPGRHGTFRDAEKRLADIARMGFDVLYLPPIHPIGRANRKGPNNSLRAGPDDPGSPWAIGAEEGGHTAVHPALGALEDFARFLKKAGEYGIEVALDIAFQCAPDHPWAREHPEWFRHRPDGTIKHAENPPKKYEDIFPLDFECRQWRELWRALHEVVLFWIRQGVRVFRVDNPHTKSLRFWEWLIREVRAEHPEVIFLAEAFTRPKVMFALAKGGFNQSYTYFTWRNTKRELMEYLIGLTRDEPREFFRPNFFANTPDILPEYLQFGGKPAFIIRLVLAATLGSTYGIYSGFELCEARAIAGTEEYLDSEKYQIRWRDWRQSPNIVNFITKINAIRRQNPALAFNDSLRFHPVDNDTIIAYTKMTREPENCILAVVNLDPHHAHEGWVEAPIDELGIKPNEIYQVHDLISDSRYLWQGARNFVRLDPNVSPAQIFRVRRRIRTERDFDYFM